MEMLPENLAQILYGQGLKVRSFKVLSLEKEERGYGASLDISNSHSLYVQPWCKLDINIFLTTGVMNISNIMD